MSSTMNPNRKTNGKEENKPREGSGLHSKTSTLPPVGEVEKFHEAGHRRVDANLYATKKTVAQGLMDIALLTANASQLKYVLRDSSATFYTLNVTCISISVALQLIVGVLLIVNTRYNINYTSHQSKAETVNNLTLVGIFLMTVSNVFVSAFSASPR